MTASRILLGAVIAAAIWGKGGSLVQQAPASASAHRNPMAEDTSAKMAGGKLYARECASCHGAMGEGSGKAPPLARPDIRRAAPGSLFWVLRNGALRHGMPSFAHLQEAQRWQIVTFLQKDK